MPKKTKATEQAEQQKQVIAATQNMRGVYVDTFVVEKKPGNLIRIAVCESASGVYLPSGCVTMTAELARRMGQQLLNLAKGKSK